MAITEVSTAAGITEGDDVFVFYSAEKMNRGNPPTYMAVMDLRHGSYRPRTGMTQGWVSARAKHCSDNLIRVTFSWDLFFDERGRCTDPDDGTLFDFPVNFVRPASDFTAPPRFFMPGNYNPKLAILSFRWGGKNEVVAPEQWGSSGSSCSTLFLQSFIELSVQPRLGLDYEVWSVFVEDSSDLVKIADTAHLIFGPHHPVRRAQHVCAMYFIYPTSFEENCVPTAETGEDEGAAHVSQKSLFRMMQAVEKAGIPTQFPHSAGFYEVLTSKRWTHMMTLTPQMRVPPTVALPRMLIEKDIVNAATCAIQSLREIKTEQARLRNEDVAKVDQPITKGVAKLGYSWEALDVKFWEGQEGLEAALFQLTQYIEISGSLTGQPHDCESLLIQEYCEHDIELRLYVVNGKVEGKIYTKFCKIKANNEFGDFQQEFTPEPVAANWMAGDRAALDDGERQCLEITAHWMAWIQAQICEIPPGIRFDYFIGRSPEKGKAIVWTLEICELGYSMLGEEQLPRKTFDAMLHHCLDKMVDDVSGDKTPAIAVPKGKAAPRALAAKEANQGPPQEPAQMPAQKAEKSSKGKGKSNAPEVLYVNVPLGTSEQKQCTGKYDIHASFTASGQPVWGKEGSPPRWIYLSDQDHYWYIGDDDEKNKDFRCNEGYIRCKGTSNGAQGYALPHMLDEAWERFEEQQDNWYPRQEILVAPEADVLDVPPPVEAKGAGKGAKGSQRQARSGKAKKR